MFGLKCFYRFQPNSGADSRSTEGEHLRFSAEVAQVRSSGQNQGRKSRFNSSSIVELTKY